MRQAVEKVLHDNSLLAIIIRSDYKSEGIEFFTPNDFSHQLAYMNWPAGYKIWNSEKAQEQRKMIRKCQKACRLLNCNFKEFDLWYKVRHQLNQIILNRGNAEW